MAKAPAALDSCVQCLLVLLRLFPTMFCRFLCVPFGCLLQVLLAAAQNPLLGEHHFAKVLLPRLCSIILSAHKATRHVRSGAVQLSI